MPAGSKFSHRVGDENLSPEELEARRREAQVRGELLAGKTRRHAWLNIAGPLGAVLIAIMLAAFYKNPIGVLRFVQSTQLGWSGVQKSEVGLDMGLMTYYINGGYPDMEPVIMIHGLGPNAALVWRDVMGPIGQGHYKVMAPNLYGFADSEHQQIDHSIAYQAAGIAKFIDQMKIDKVNLIGWDLGADVALYYAVDHPDKVETIDPGLGRALRRGLGEEAAAGPVTDLDRGDAAAGQGQLLRSAADAGFHVRAHDGATLRRCAGRDRNAQFDSQGRGPHPLQAGQLFNTLTVVMWGGKDPYFGARQGDAIKSALPGSATITFKTSGHYPQLEHPEEFTDSMLFVFKQTEGGQ